MAFGLLTTGLAIKTLTDIRAERQARARAGFGASAPLGPTSVLGNLIDPDSEREAEIWEVLQAIYSSGDRDKATGQSLDAVGALTGTERLDAQSSTVNATYTGTPGTVLLAGRVTSVAVTEVRFVTTVDGAPFVLATSWAISTAYVVGNYRTNAGNIYYCIADGTSAGSGGPTGTDPAADITDGTAHWRFVGAGTGYTVIATASEDTGPLIALTGTLVNIETSFSGWNGVNNVADAVPGRDVEGQDAYRLRQENELPGDSASTFDAIRVRVAEAVGVDSSAVLVFVNNTASVNGDGMPPKSVEVLVDGGDDQDITDAVWANVGGGIEPFGNQPGNFVTDVKNGQTYPVGWSRPVLKNTYIDIHVTKDPNTFPADGTAQIQAALLAYGVALKNGRDVVARAVLSSVFAVDGVLNVTACNIGLAPSPVTEVTVVIAARERAVFDSARITITLADGTP